MSTLEWKVERKKISDLIPFEGNPRTISEKGMEKLKDRIQKRGFHDVLKVDTNNVVLSGNQRLQALTELGVEEVDVKTPSRKLKDNERKIIVLESNRMDGEWDRGKLPAFGEDIVLESGFSTEEVDMIFESEIIDDEFDAEAEYNKIKTPQTKRGDIYLLGQHRLMCGDSTSRVDVLKLMDGKKAQMIFTDPPYNVDYKYAKYEAIGGGRKKKFENNGRILNDKKTPEAFYRFLLDTFVVAFEVTTDDMALYCCHATRSQQQFFTALHDAGFHFSQTIIWLKERIILAMGQDYHRIYEPIWFGWKEGKKHYKNKTITTESEVWDVDRLSFEERLDMWYIHREKSINYDHPTQKPVRLSERAIKKNCPWGGYLFEPFGGSGSTMVAAHQLGRKCYTMELDPKYCDVIVKRYEQHTGDKAIKI